jgi:hypothetical protein
MQAVIPLLVVSGLLLVPVISAIAAWQFGRRA